MSTSNTLNIAKVCVSLTIQAIEQGLEDDLNFPRKLYCAYQTISDINTDDPTDETLDITGNQLYAMCGGYAFSAENLINGSSGGVIVNPSTGTATLNDIREQFVVGDSGALLVVGQTTLTIDIGVGSIFQSGTFQIELDQSILPRNTSAYVSYTLSYAAGIITVVLNQAAQTSQLYVITGQYLTS